MPNPHYNVTVAITTKNRKDDLRNAVRTALEQACDALQVLVVDDGSDDGTTDMLVAEFPPHKHPNLKLDRQERSLGLIAERNRMGRLADGDIIISIDDDAVFVSPHTVAQTLREFDNPRVGAVAIPYIDIKISPDVRQQSPKPNQTYIAEQFRGTAHALRRELFLALGGYRAQLVRQGEEQDYCIRMLDAGYVVKLGGADALHHLESPRRSKPQIYMYTARNNLLFAWHNTPMPHVLLHLPGVIANMLADGLRHPARLWPRILGLWRGLLMLPAEGRHRRPVSPSAYRLSRELRKHGPRLLSDIEPRLPNIRSFTPSAGAHSQPAERIS